MTNTFAGSIPKIYFISCKHRVFKNNIINNNRHFSGRASNRASIAHALNYATYHAFHEFGQCFDFSRRCNNDLVRGKELILFVLMLALLNAEIQRVYETRKKNTSAACNLSLNVQSLGKAYDNCGFHIFAENSIHFVKNCEKNKNITNNIINTNSDTSSDDNRNAMIKKEEKGGEDRSFTRCKVRGVLVDRFLGNAPYVGINSVNLIIPIQRTHVLTI